MLKSLLLKFLISQVENAIKSGKIGELISKAIGGLLPKLSITIDGTPANNTLKDILMESLLEVVRNLLATGKLNDLILKLLGGLLGSKNFTLPVATTQAVDVEVKDNKVQITHDDGKVYEVDLS